MEMEPPLKRPRLSMFSRDLPPDETLTRARWRNDLSLKSRFEAIFEKYAHDFTGIGDEIEVATGKVVVNNGHLEAMADEKDTGTGMDLGRTPPNRPGHINGGSLLRAMTAAPEDNSHSFEDVQDNDVVLSIENMAENAAAYSEEGGDEDDGGDDIESTNGEDPTDAGYSAEEPVVLSTGWANSYDNLEEGDNSSDEELFQTADNSFVNQPNLETPAFLDQGHTDSGREWTHDVEHNAQMVSSNNIIAGIVFKQRDGDCSQERQSLLENGDNDRSSSPDSLFEEEVARGLQYRQAEHQGQEHAYPELRSICREVSDDAIIDKFGPEIGPQVIDVLQKRRAVMDAHIEPAWRVPDIGVVFPKAKLETPPDDFDLSPEHSSGRKDSLWRDIQASEPALQGPQYPTSRKVRGSSQLSNESEDPLQEDFKLPRDVDNLSDDGNLEVPLYDLQHGICPFCQKQFSVRGSVYVHWDELIKKAAHDGVHDMAYIQHQRSHKRRRSQFPKVTVQDFHQMIRLREVDNLDWQEICDRGFFGQRPSTSIQSIYYQYRTLSKTDEELAAEGRSWTTEEDRKLLGFCKDPSITFQKLRKLMRTRPQAELGNRLASIWMEEYSGQGIELESPPKRASSSCKTAGYTLARSLEPCQAGRSTLRGEGLRRSWSSDSMDSLFQVDVSVQGNSDAR